MLPAEHLAKGNAAVSQVQALASLFTPFLGGMTYAAFGLLPVLWGAVLCFYLTAGRLRLRRLAAVFLGFGLCLLPAGLVFALPLNSSVR